MNEHLDHMIVGIQVIPTEVDEKGGVEAMIEGPTPLEERNAFTEYQWSVYHRLANGQARWVADYSDRLREDAFAFGNHLAARYAVRVEQYDWMTDEDRSASY